MRLGSGQPKPIAAAKTVAGIPSHAESGRPPMGLCTHHLQKARAKREPGGSASGGSRSDGWGRGRWPREVAIRDHRCMPRLTRKAPPRNGAMSESGSLDRDEMVRILEQIIRDWIPTRRRAARRSGLCWRSGRRRPLRRMGRPRRAGAPTPQGKDGPVSLLGSPTPAARRLQGLQRGSGSPASEGSFRLESR